MSHTNDDYLNIAVEAALAASQLIMDSQNYPQGTSYKGKTDLVTKTDLASEKLIKLILLSYFPSHSILAEESGHTHRKSDYEWIIDPLDGTTNFVHGYPSFAVSIALFYQNTPLVGVVLEMPNMRLYTAIKNKGAWCEGSPINCSKTSTLDKSLLVTGFGYEHGSLWEKNMNLFKQFTDMTQGVRRLGAASVDLCHVASGKVDGFWEYDLKPWDTAAGLIIATESGCKVTKLSGDAYSIYDNNILVTNGAIHSAMIQEIERII